MSDEKEKNICLEAILMFVFVVQYDNFFSLPGVSTIRGCLS